MPAVSFEAPAGRLDAVLAARLQVPRAEAQRRIAEGRVRVDGAPRAKSFRLKGGEVIEAQAGDSVLEPDRQPVHVLFEDEHLMVVSKPAGVLTHPTASRRKGTLVNRLLATGLPLSTAGPVDRPGIVHRLDAGTSGLLVVVKTEEAHHAMSRMFRRHEVSRRYLALVRGRLEHDQLLIEAPLERRRARIAVSASAGKHAATEVGVRERFRRSTLLEARPRTGRTHQIRVHLSSIGHPILGDRAYGGGGRDAEVLGLTRPFLHAWEIAFRHPLTGERLHLTDPLPDDLSRALARASEPVSSGGSPRVGAMW